MTQANERRLRAIVRTANAQKRLRIALRQLPDATLLTRLGRYTGRTKSELRNEYHRAYSPDLNRERLIDAIVRIEVP